MKGTERGGSHDANCNRGGGGEGEVGVGKHLSEEVSAVSMEGLLTAIETGDNGEGLTI